VNADETFVFTASGARRRADGQQEAVRSCVAPRARVALSCTLTSLESERGEATDAEVEITYRNVSNNRVFFRPPINAVNCYRGLRLSANGRDVPFHVKHDAAGLYVFPEQVTIEPGAEYTFRVRISDVWDMPVNWKTIVLRHTGLHSPVDEHGRPVRCDTEECHLARTGSAARDP